MTLFQVTHGVLSVQTDQENKKLDNYQSNVNILQVSTPFDSTNEQVLETSNSSQNTSNSSGYISNNSSSQNSISRKEPLSNSSKTGRPILGK